MTTYSKHFYRSIAKSLAQQNVPSRARYAAFGLGLAVLCGASGCNGLPNAKEAATETAKNVPQTYMAPIVGNNTGGVTADLEIYTFDNVANTFQQATNALRNGSQSQINTSGNLAPLARNLLELETTYTFPVGQGGPTSGVTGTTYSPALPGSWAVQLPDKTGGFVQLVTPPSSPVTRPTQPVTPLVSAVCPASTTAQTYNFITLPNALLAQPAGSSQSPAYQMWDPVFETAYGSVAISGTAGSVTLASTHQSTLTGAAPGTAYAASATGVCSSTLYGSTISVPGALTVTSPGSGESLSAAATIGISASGLLVEDNGSNLANGSAYANGLFYQNALGAGTGAIGMLKPSSAVNLGTVVGAQYNGFILGTGNSASGSNLSSTVASFGFSTVPASCASVTSPTSTLLYGGDFPHNDPSTAAVQSGGGYGNCDYAIDLGTQDSANNGLYPAATVWVGASFGGNTTGSSYSFPAVAIAGTVAGKNAIFLLGVDTTGTPSQAVGIYLLQSN